ncbi:MAG: agmatinase [Deltaproteobacteria bacterium RBG_16_48_10]|nr:MAG: agmatinase [Deltaproteobacteria bacterium RBG_16_48_10]
MKLPFIEAHYISAKASFQESDAVILGCPFDGTASFRPGARFGPPAIRRASWGIESYSPYLQKDLKQVLVHDMGDLELPLGDKKEAFRWIGKALQQILRSMKFPILLGGDHLITLPVIEKIFRVYPDLHLLHIDAHADLRKDYLGEALSHSTVMRKIIDFFGQGRLFHMGIRSGTEEEFHWAKKTKSIVSLDGSSLRNLVKRLKGKPVYISLDLDVIDPSLLPGVGTPEPGGLTFQEFLSLLKSLQPLRVIGFDIVELTPDYDPTQISSVTASVILREMILSFVHPKFP